MENCVNILLPIYKVMTVFWFNSLLLKLKCQIRVDKMLRNNDYCETVHSKTGYVAVNNFLSLDFICSHQCVTVGF